VIALALVVLAVVFVIGLVMAIAASATGAAKDVRRRPASDAAFDHLMHIQTQGIIDAATPQAPASHPLDGGMSTGFDTSQHHGSHTHHVDPGIVHHQPLPAPDPSFYTPPDTSSGHHGHH
jgi:hypothetical protein